MKKIFTILLLLCTYEIVSAQQIKLASKSTKTIHSASENLERKIYVQLPMDYGKVNKRYPIILLFDAQDQSLYNYTSSVVDRLTWTNDIPEAILVGVVQNDRSKELNFERNENSSLQFLDFIKNDLLGYLNKSYSLNGYYMLIGHSLGGQFVTNAMLTYPEIFKSAISISGALNYPNQDNVIKSKILSKIDDYLANTPDDKFKHQKYYFSSGDDGYQESGFKLGAMLVDSSLKDNKPNLKAWHFELLKGFNHMTTPLVSIPAGLLFVFQDWHFSDSLAMDVLLYNKKDPLDVLQGKKEKIAKSYGNEIELPYNSYAQFASYYLSKGEINKAELLLNRLIKLYPHDDETYSLMAEVAIKRGKFEDAIDYYKKAQSKSSKDKYAEKINSLMK